MLTPTYISIAHQLKEVFLEKREYNDINIFLCGGAGKEQKKFRYSLGEKIEKTSSKYNYNVYYPESLFYEQLHGHLSTNLLSLENLLANSVHSVIIPLQSPGTFAELGAFVNHSQLKDKLIIITDEKYRTSKSFINDGPLRLLKNNSNSVILYHDLINYNLESLTPKITEAARKISKSVILKYEIKNPLLAIDFILSLIYVFDPISESFLHDIIFQIDNSHDATVSVSTIMSKLFSNGLIQLIDNKFITFGSISFQDAFSQSGFNKSTISILSKKITKLRIDALHYHLKRSYWGERT